MEFNITAFQILFTLLTVLTIFLFKYNRRSDNLEETENQTYSQKLFWLNNWMNILADIFAGVVILGMLNEIGVEWVLKSVLNADLSLTEETATDITTAVISGFSGKIIFKKFTKSKGD